MHEKPLVACFLLAFVGLFGFRPRWSAATGESSSGDVVLAGSTAAATGLRGGAMTAATAGSQTLFSALPLSDVDCEACYHLPADPNIFGHYAGTHCPCLRERRVADPRPSLTMPVPDDLRSRTTAAQLYLNLMKATVLNTVYKDSPAMQDGSSHPDFESRLTMVGRRRLDNTQQLLQAAIQEGIRGDFIETGTWRGGSAMFATAVLSVYGELADRGGEGGRRVWLADSFHGIPEVKPEQYPEDAAHAGAERLSAHEHNSAGSVLRSFERVGLLPEGGAATAIAGSGPVRVLEGYFNETLPERHNQAVFAQRRFALIRADGDTYESTIQALDALYKHLSVGGFVVVDDYMDWVGARRAAIDFRRRHRITSPIVPVYHDRVRFQGGDAPGEVPRGVWWRKTEEIREP